MKPMILATLVLTLAASAFAKDYTCTLNDKYAKGTGTLAVTFDGDTVQATGELDAKDTDGNDLYAAKINCDGKRYTKETNASYYKGWAVYPVSTTGGCSESSLRVSKDASGKPDMKSLLVIDYNGDNHDYSGYQSFLFSCTVK